MFSLKLPKNVNVSLKPTKRQNNPKKVSIRQIYPYKFEKKKLKLQKIESLFFFERLEKKKRKKKEEKNENPRGAPN
jgi:hypothetical protein